jgi:hypothetical protein
LGAGSIRRGDGSPKSALVRAACKRDTTVVDRHHGVSLLSSDCMVELFGRGVPDLSWKSGGVLRYRSRGPMGNMRSSSIPNFRK